MHSVAGDMEGAEVFTAAASVGEDSTAAADSMAEGSPAAGTWGLTAEDVRLPAFMAADSPEDTAVGEATDLDGAAEAGAVTVGVGEEEAGDGVGDLAGVGHGGAGDGGIHPYGYSGYYPWYYSYPYSYDYPYVYPDDPSNGYDDPPPMDPSRRPRPAPNANGPARQWRPAPPDGAAGNANYVDSSSEPYEGQAPVRSVDRMFIASPTAYRVMRRNAEQAGAQTDAPLRPEVQRARQRLQQMPPFAREREIEVRYSQFSPEEKELLRNAD